MLEGAELLAKTKQMGKCSRSDLVRECGYYKVVDGKERLNFTAFYEAILRAKNIDLRPSRRLGRKLTHQAKVQADGKVIIGSRYLESMNLEPGTAFDIKVGRNNIVLTAATAH